MVEPLLLVEILHGSKDSQVPSLLPEEETSTPGNSTELLHPRRLDEEYSSYTCRVCLKEGQIPIYGNEEADDIPEALLTFGGIQIEIEDTYPKYLCQNCYDLLRGAILFRRTAQQTDQVLKKSCESDTIEDTTELSNPGEEMIAEEYEDDHEEELKALYCKKCEIQFSEVKEFCDHRLSKEHEQKRMTCTICNKSYTAAYYYKHKAIHKSDFSVACDLCGSKFVTKAQLVRHRMTHFYKLPFKCDQCPYRGRFSTCLKRHMRSHTGERPYECPECASRFICKSNLNKHIKTHKVDYDFKCKSCGKGFNSKKELEVHIRVDHEGVKEHICDLCGKAFGYRKQMMKHQLKVHKREKFKSGGIPLYLQLENMDESTKQKLENS